MSADKRGFPSVHVLYACTTVYSLQSKVLAGLGNCVAHGWGPCHVLSKRHNKKKNPSVSTIRIPTRTELTCELLPLLFCAPNKTVSMSDFRMYMPLLHCSLQSEPPTMAWPHGHFLSFLFSSLFLSLHSTASSPAPVSLLLPTHPPPSVSEWHTNKAAGLKNLNSAHPSFR